MDDTETLAQLKAYVAEKDARGQKRGSMPSIDRIAEYWANRCLKCDSTWRECADFMNHQRYAMFCDLGEPECARCKRFLGYTGHAIRHFHGNCKSCDWATDEPECACGDAAKCKEYPRVRCDRAHMVPWAVCRANDVENIIPLCHHCHRINPHPSDIETGRREYLDWLCSERDMLIHQMRALAEDITKNKTAILAAWDKDGTVHPAINALIRYMHPEPIVGEDELARELIEIGRPGYDYAHGAA